MYILWTNVNIGTEIHRFAFLKLIEHLMISNKIIYAFVTMNKWYLFLHIFLVIAAKQENSRVTNASNNLVQGCQKC